MRHIWKILLQGLVAVLPIALTVYLVYWLAVSIERILSYFITLVIPESLYWPGMGFIAGLMLLFFIGLLVNAWLVQRIIEVGENLINRIPLIKSIYSGIKDFMEFFSVTQESKELKHVVLVPFGDAQLIGFVTSNQVRDFPNSDKLAAVYLPMSYQMGGYTIYIDKNKLETLDISIEDAMRRVLTANLSKSKN